MGKFTAILSFVVSFVITLIVIEGLKMYLGDGHGTVIALLLIGAVYMIVTERHIRNTRKLEEQKVEAVKAFIKSLEPETVRKGLEAATIEFQTVAVKHNELKMLYEGDRTALEQHQINKAKEVMEIAREKYYMIRSMVAVCRDDFPIEEGEHEARFLPPDWAP